MIKILIPWADGIYSIAAAAFSEMWKAVTGAPLEIVTEDDGTSDLVSLGSDASSAFTHGKIIEGVLPQFRLAVGTDAYALRSVKDSNGRRLLFIAGAHPRALLYGVYAFFELQANCRYFWDGDIIPKANDISLEGLDVYGWYHIQFKLYRKNLIVFVNEEPVHTGFIKGDRPFSFSVDAHDVGQIMLKNVNIRANE